MELHRMESSLADVALAIEERIQRLEEELAHWREMLSQCQKTPLQQPAPGEEALKPY